MELADKIAEIILAGNGNKVVINIEDIIKGDSKWYINH